MIHGPARLLSTLSNTSWWETHWWEARSNDTVDGLGGDDLIEAGHGDDIIHGRGGNDVLHGRWGRDTLFGEGGNDILFGESFTRGVDPDTGGGTNEVVLEGSNSFSDGDTLSGGDNDDQLFGFGGPDLLHGDAGNDRLFGGDGGDAWWFGGGLFGDAGNDWISGGQEDDYLEGGADSDNLFGDEGRDWLDGGPGSDWLAGGAGYRGGDSATDFFAYKMTDGAGRDTITDFESIDTIQLFGVQQLNANGDNVIDENDGGRVSMIDGNLTFNFDGENSLTVLGVSTLPVENVGYWA